MGIASMRPEEGPPHPTPDEHADGDDLSPDLSYHRPSNAGRPPDGDGPAWSRRVVTTDGGHRDRRARGIDRATYQGGHDMLELITRIQERLAAQASDRGATAVEYGLMVALIAAAIVLTVTALGGSLNGLFTSVTGTISGA